MSLDADLKDFQDLYAVPLMCHSLSCAKARETGSEGQMGSGLKSLIPSDLLILFLLSKKRVTIRTIRKISDLVIKEKKARQRRKKRRQ